MIAASRGLKRPGANQDDGRAADRIRLTGSPAIIFFILVERSLPSRADNQELYVPLLLYRPRRVSQKVARVVDLAADLQRFTAQSAVCRTEDSTIAPHPTLIVSLSLIHI